MALYFHPTFIPFNRLFRPIFNFDCPQIPTSNFQLPFSDFRIQKSSGSINVLSGISQGQS